MLTLLALTAVAGCSSKTADPTPATPAATPPSHSWTQLGPTGGFFTSVAFDPAHAGTVWASGDDGGGLYESTDGGANWDQIQTGAPDQATYSMRFDPNDSAKLYAPNHFGRGMLRSTNGGLTWIAAQAGLPIDGTQGQQLDDLAISPANSNLLFAATDEGLYKSTDGGASFAAVVTSTVGTNNVVRAVAFRSDGVVFIGKADGSVGYSGDSGATWSQLLAANGIPVAVITFSSTSLYLCYATAAIFKVDKTSFAGGLINDPTQAGAIKNGNRFSIAVKSGASASADVIWVGTMGVSAIPQAQWGLFRSTDGGATWSRPMTGITTESIMAVAIDPFDVNHVIAGSGSGSGLLVTRDAGAHWTTAQQHLYSTASLGLAQDPTSTGHLLASNTACGGFSMNFETSTGGASWSRFADPVADDGVLAFDLSSAGSARVLAGTCTQGIYQSTTGTAGPWTRITTTASHRIDRFVRDRSNTSLIYAVVPDGDASHSLYVSTNDGDAFAPITGRSAWNLAVSPFRSSEAVVVTAADVFATSDHFAHSTSLGLSASATAAGGFTAAAYDPANSARLVVAGGYGTLYATSNYQAGGGGVTWTALPTPTLHATIRDVVISVRGGRSVYYIAVTAPDTGVTPGATQGVFRSLDGGASWTLISGPLFPSDMPWRIVPDLSSPTTSFLLGMWAGGLFRLTDTE